MMTNREWIEKMSNKQWANRLQKLITCNHCPVETCNRMQTVQTCKNILQKWLESEAE